MHYHTIIVLQELFYFFPVHSHWQKNIYISPSPPTLAFYLFFIYFYFFMFIYFCKRAREWGRGSERGRHRIGSRLQALSCQHRARRRARTHELWGHDLSRSRTLNRLSHPGAPGSHILKIGLTEKCCGEENHILDFTAFQGSRDSNSHFYICGASICLQTEVSLRGWGDDGRQQVKRELSGCLGGLVT